MRETNVYAHFAFGYNYFLLRNQTPGPIVRGQRSLESGIRDFLTKLGELKLPVTMRAAGEIEALVRRLDTYADDAVVDAGLAKEVRSAFERIDATLDAELQLCRAFVLTPRRSNLDHLLSTPEALFAPGVFLKLSDLGRFDFRSACRAIAFGLSTGAAFHLMRAVEGTLRQFYCAHVKRDRVPKLMWFEMVDHLRKRKGKGSASKALLDALDNIRVNFRNPTQHPDARYDIEAAQDLLFVCIDVLNRMALGLPARPA
jgi:hypothetical protein